MDFLSDYWEYNSQYEIKRSYAFWCAFATIGATVNRQICFKLGDIPIYSSIYVLLVGPQGNKKSTPVNFAHNLFRDVNPNLYVGAATQSAEDIVTIMSKDSFAKVSIGPDGQKILVSPAAFFVNEFKDWIAYAPVRMLNFLGNIFDYPREVFDASTIKRGCERIINPCMNVLACENPLQLIGFIKNSIFTGGLSRRFIVVNELDYADPKPDIDIPPGSPARLAWERVKQRLIDLKSIHGYYQWHPSGKKFYNAWYIETMKRLKEEPSEMMKGYKSTKNVNLLKLTMHLDAVSDKPMLLLTSDLMELALAHLDSIEPNMPRLSLGAGRNEMAQSYQRTLEILETEGGIMPEKVLKRKLESELTPFETTNALRHMEETDQIIKKCMKIPNPNGVPVERWMVLTPKRWKDGVDKGEFKV